MAGSDSALSKEQFLEKLQAVVKEAGNQGIVVFVHGSFNDGQRSKHQAIRLSEALQSPVILFDTYETRSKPIAAKTISASF